MERYKYSLESKVYILGDSNSYIIIGRGFIEEINGGHTEMYVIQNSQGYRFVPVYLIYNSLK